MTQPEPDRRLDLPSLHNARDLGGLPAAGGRRTVANRVIRATDLHRLSAEDAELLAGRGVSLVVDLRSAAERARFPDRMPAGASDLHLDVMADGQTDPTMMRELLADPAGTAHLLADGRAHDYMFAAYRDIVALPSARAAYAAFARALLSAEGQPVLVHCTTGKDRTGWAAAMVLLAAGVPYDHVAADYLQSNDDLPPAVAPLLEVYRQGGGDPDLLAPVLGVRQEYLEHALDHMSQLYGTFEGYLTDGLRLSPAELDQLGDYLTS